MTETQLPDRDAEGHATSEAMLPPRQNDRRTRWLGLWSLVAAIALLLLEVVAIVLGSTGQWSLSTILAWAVIVLTAASFVVGLLAVALGRGRGWGAAGAVLSVLVNPLVQLWVLGLPLG